MRADKRSFSFTWMRGQKGGADDNTSKEAPAHQQLERSNTTWYMTNSSTSSSSSGVSSMSETSSVNSTTHENEANEDKGKENSSLTRSDTSMGKLRRLGSSFTRFGTKYSIIEDDEVPIPSTADSNNDSDEQMQQQSEETTKELKEPMHFDEDGNFIGRAMKPVSTRRKSCASIKDPAGSVPGSSASFGRKINKTVQEMKVSIGNFSQKFRRSTRRRYRMGPGTPLTEATPTRKILGRTPTKLYSPFGIGFDSPAFKTPKRLVDRPSTPRLTRRSLVSASVYSPSNNFRQDLAEARRGMEDFQILSRDITRRSVRF